MNIMGGNSTMNCVIWSQNADFTNEQRKKIGSIRNVNMQKNKKQTARHKRLSNKKGMKKEYQRWLLFHARQSEKCVVLASFSHFYGCFVKNVFLETSEDFMNNLI